MLKVVEPVTLPLDQLNLGVNLFRRTTGCAVFKIIANAAQVLLNHPCRLLIKPPSNSYPSLCLNGKNCGEVIVKF
jgi:hypothetical protein